MEDESRDDEAEQESAEEVNLIAEEEAQPHHRYEYREGPWETASNRWIHRCSKVSQVNLTRIGLQAILALLDLLQHSPAVYHDGTPAAPTPVTCRAATTCNPSGRLPPLDWTAEITA